MRARLIVLLLYSNLDDLGPRSKYSQGIFLEHVCFLTKKDMAGNVQQDFFQLQHDPGLGFADNKQSL